MRWDDLFADLEAGFAEQAAAELAAEVSDRARSEVAALTAAARVAAAVGSDVRMDTTAGALVSGRLTQAGPDWLLVQEAVGREALVPLAALRRISGLGRATRPADPRDRVGQRLDLRFALRAIARDRSGVHLVLAGGAELAGTIDRVGRDYLELASHPAGEARRATAVRGIDLIPLPALAVLRRAA